MVPMKKKMRTIGLVCILATAILLGVGAYGKYHSSAHSASGRQAGPKATGGSIAKPGFDKTKYSNDDPASIWLVVNKKRPLNPKEYAPADLVIPAVTLRTGSKDTEMEMRAEPAKALEDLTVAAKSEAGLQFMLASGYRSYSFQVGLYNRYVQQQGQTVADTQSARPGYSEHQTGLAADLEPASRTCEVENCFSTTAEGKWLAANAYRFGFIIRYPEGQQSTTGYIYEPWHVRYVGKDLALEMHKANAKTLEDFCSVPAAADY
jgi:D-alanyl-D-alanine carboxypeptidase